MSAFSTGCARSSNTKLVSPCCLKYSSRGKLASRTRLVMLTTFSRLGWQFKSNPPPFNKASVCWAPRAISASWRFFLRIMRVLKRRFTVEQTLHTQLGWCFPLPLGGCMHTMHEQPARCLGCFVVAAADDVAPRSPVSANDGFVGFCVSEILELAGAQFIGCTTRASNTERTAMLDMNSENLFVFEVNKCSTKPCIIVARPLGREKDVDRHFSPFEATIALSPLLVLPEFDRYTSNENTPLRENRWFL
ncbi:HXXXD-type acyl-transferase family protein [Striga asiatica]|uniref:HXXXD-type acyl-transferase family protein n=1 Tax=Striga asiatica TaxID=4170 RepID=A0A5A7REZ1_STRAF|nr:HXXXD-type acyl-transferase family protein [Striga asiatica]